MDLQLNTARDFWIEIVEADISAFSRQRDNLRLAFHVATSLFHVSDWIFHDQKSGNPTVLNWQTPNGAQLRSTDEKAFANSLEKYHADFGRIRGIAHAGKHARLHAARPVAGAPLKASDIGADHGAFSPAFSDAFATTRIMLIGPDGRSFKFQDLMVSTYEMWKSLMAHNGWMP